MAKKQAKPAQWANRIVGHTEEDPAQLLANPLNFRHHPGAQREALRGSISELGWIKAVLVNRTTGHVIDGHARCEEAITAGATVPVDWVEMTEAEERLALAVLDPITEMATRDDEALAALLADVSTQDAGLQTLLDEMAGRSMQQPTSSSSNEIDTDSFVMECRCPKCGFEFDPPRRESL